MQMVVICRLRMATEPKYLYLGNVTKGRQPKQKSIPFSSAKRNFGWVYSRCAKYIAKFVRYILKYAR